MIEMLDSKDRLQAKIQQREESFKIKIILNSVSSLTDCRCEGLRPGVFEHIDYLALKVLLLRFN